MGGVGGEPLLFGHLGPTVALTPGCGSSSSSGSLQAPARSSQQCQLPRRRSVLARGQRGSRRRQHPERPRYCDRGSLRGWTSRLATLAGVQLSRGGVAMHAQRLKCRLLSFERLSMGTHTRARVGVVVGYGVLSGIWIYAAKRGGSPFSTEAVSVAVLALGLVVGFVVRRAWMWLSLIGPLVGLAYLEVSGFVGSGDWGREPLLSPPGIFVFIGVGMVLLFGRALGEGWDLLRAGARARRPSEPWGSRRRGTD
jgi:hypothetical protein